MKKLVLIAAIGSIAAISAPASAAELPALVAPSSSFGMVTSAPTEASLDYGRPKWKDRRRGDRRYRGRDRYDDRGRYRNPQRLSRRDRVWRGRDGRYYCQRDNGTTGLVIGAGLGALLGRTVDTRGDRTVGTVLGALAGGLLGREIDRGELRCR